MNNTPVSLIMLLASALAGFAVFLEPVATAQETGKHSSTASGQPAATRSDGPKVASTSPRLLTDRPDDEKAIRAVGDAFTRSFAASDAKTVAAMYTEDAELIDENARARWGDRRSKRFTLGSFKQDRTRRSIFRSSRSSF